VKEGCEGDSYRRLPETEDKVTGRRDIGSAREIERGSDFVLRRKEFQKIPESNRRQEDGAMEVREGPRGGLICAGHLKGIKNGDGSSGVEVT